MTESQFSQVINNEGRPVQANNNRGALGPVNEKPIDQENKKSNVQKYEENRSSPMLSMDFGKSVTIEPTGASKQDPTKNASVAAENPVGTI
jgi:hypothetical protein